MCREACGGEGYISANRLPALKSDADIFTTFEGDNTVLMLWIGRNLLTHGAPVSVRGEDTSEGMGASESAGVEDLEACIRLFRIHERVTLEEVQAELERLAGAGVEALAAMAGQQTALLHAANACIERVILECVIAQVDRCTGEDAALAPTLRKLAELFACALIERDRGWYLENGYLTAAESKSMAGRVDALCAELAPDAVALVDAFGIPAEILAAPIAFDGDAC